MHVWDIATKTWFTQNTTAEAGLYPINQSSDLCSVVASAEDNSSHNIYLYRGGDFTDQLGIFILTLPAFHWVLVYNHPPAWDRTEATGTECLKVHEKHMVVYHGYPGPDKCDSELGKFQGMEIYDMSSLTWTTEVRFKDQKYLVPGALHAIIGGK